MTRAELERLAEMRAEGAKAAVQYMTKHENYIEGFTQGALDMRSAAENVFDKHTYTQSINDIKEEIAALGEGE